MTEKEDSALPEFDGILNVFDHLNNSKDGQDDSKTLGRPSVAVKPGGECKDHFDIASMLLSTFSVVAMQLGFAMLEALYARDPVPAAASSGSPEPEPLGTRGGRVGRLEIYLKSRDMEP